MVDKKLKESIIKLEIRGLHPIPSENGHLWIVDKIGPPFYNELITLVLSTFVSLFDPQSGLMIDGDPEQLRALDGTKKRKDIFEDKEILKLFVEEKVTC